VVAVIEQPFLFISGQWIDRIELEYLYATDSEALKEFPGRMQAADAVVNQVDLDAGGLSFQQQIRELSADIVVSEDVGFQVDVIFGLADGREHGPVGRRPVLQQDQPVAQHQRAVGVNRLFQGQVFLQYVDVTGFALEFFEDGGALVCRDRAARVIEFHRLCVRLSHLVRGVGEGCASGEGE